MTQELKGIAIILACYFSGDFASRLIGGFMPGSIMGMLILFTLLQYKVVKKEDIKSVANFVLSHMMLFFIPVTVGIIVCIHTISDHWLAVAVVLFATTTFVLLTVGFIGQLISKKWKK
ncbi:MAG: CidA/LrgA family protein [Rikenellaceae bacterium]